MKEIRNDKLRKGMTQNKSTQRNNDTAVPWDQNLLDVESMTSIIKSLSINVDDQSMIVQYRSGSNNKRSFPDGDTLESAMSYLVMSTADHNSIDTRRDAVIACCMQMYDTKIKDLATRSRTDSGKQEVFLQILLGIYSVAMQMDPVMMQSGGYNLLSDIRERLERQVRAYQ